MLSVAGVGAVYGFRAGLSYLTGIVLGSLVVMGAVASGLAALVFSIPYVCEVLLTLSLGYLLYLAYRIATSGSGIAIIEAKKPLGFGNGAMLSLINPKAYAVMTTIIGGFNFFPQNPTVEVALKFAIFSAISFPIHIMWNAIGASLKHLPLSERGQRFVNIGMAVSMLAVVALALWSENLR